jgi:hypothetical protein
MSFVSEYQDLLIKQYWEQPNATAEIELKAETWQRIFEWLDSFTNEFDVDLATGDRLDILGRIVGLSRVVPFVVDKINFGFDGNPNARGFGDKFLIVNSAPFLDKFERAYTDLQLNDNDYRAFIKAKITKNASSAYIVTEQYISIQDVVNTAFNGLAYVIDKQDMSLSLYISPTVDLERLRAIIELNLLPKPQGVRYAEFVQAEIGETFGFLGNVNSLGFADKFDLATQPGGRFANRIII